MTFYRIYRLYRIYRRIGYSRTLAIKTAWRKTHDA